MEDFPNRDISVTSPAYVVRKRLGNALNGSDNREEEIDTMEKSGEQIDNNLRSGIAADYEQEIGDVLSDFDGGGMLGGMGGASPMDPQQQQGFDDDDMSDEEQKERMRKFMRVSSLQIAYQAYPVFKSIVVN